MIDKLRKIKELAERGVGGEAEAAKRILASLQSKYSISDEELTGKELPDIFFFAAGDYGQLFVQIALSVCTAPIYNVSKMPKREKKLRGCENANVAVKCLPSEFKLIKAMFEVYSDEYRKQFANWEYAFYSVNGLLVKAAEGKKSKDSDLLNAEQIAKFEYGINKTNFHKMLQE
ncbi:MAG: hypothetical protein J5651_00425 [Salinivirgaceae bacterium]|nr:hypothetical protein [Salinivirgaceae bacterium]